MSTLFTTQLWLVALVYFIVISILFSSAVWLIRFQVNKLLNRSSANILCQIVVQTKPLIWIGLGMLYFITVYNFILVNQFNLNIMQMDSHAHISRTLAILWLMSFLIRISHGIEQHFKNIPDRKNYVFNIELVEIFMRILRIIIIVTMIIALMQLYGLQLGSILAVGGIGGIAIGLAAQDTLSNFFGGLFLLSDRPFVTGNWISSPDKNIEGEVEEIGWRMTKIRTFDKSVLFVPNSVFSKIVLENKSKMSHRRFHDIIGVRYQDAKQVSLVVQRIRDFIKNDVDVSNNMTQIVNLCKFGSSSLDIRVYCFIKKTRFIAYSESRERILLGIIDIVNELGCDFAFPTQTLDIPQLQSDSKESASE